MRFNIKITYPSATDYPVTDLDAIIRHESMLKERLVMITNASYEIYKWEKDRDSFSLKVTHGGEVVFSRSIEYLRAVDPEDLFQDVQTERAFSE